MSYGKIYDIIEKYYEPLIVKYYSANNVNVITYTNEYVSQTIEITINRELIYGNLAKLFVIFYQNYVYKYYDISKKFYQNIKKCSKFITINHKYLNIFDNIQTIVTNTFSIISKIEDINILQKVMIYDYFHEKLANTDVCKHIITDIFKIYHEKNILDIQIYLEKNNIHKNISQIILNYIIP